MYGVHIVFQDSHEAVMRLQMSRQEYSEEMRKWQREYVVRVENVETLSNGDQLIFAIAEKRPANEMNKEMEKVKSRARYYSRTDGGTGKGSRTGSGA